MAAQREILFKNSACVITPFSISSFASASVCARLETRSSSIMTGLLSGSAIVLPHRSPTFLSETREPETVNILTAMADNERLVRNESDPERKAIALAWLFHLVGDVYQPLHTAQLFTVDYPKGDRGRNEICVRVNQAGQPMDLHRCWDGVITSSQNLTRLRNDATALRNRQEFQRSQLTELASIDFESWAKESYEIATKIAYQNGGRIGIPKSENLDCKMVAAAPVLPVGYVVSASRIADRRVILAGYRLADLLTRV